jgi:flavin-dependent dehydrogenase
MHLPIIDTLELTAPDGSGLQSSLPLGGFGISRYKLDALLADIAREEGVLLLDGTKVEDVVKEQEHFYITSNSDHTRQIKASICCAASGKKSNLDIKWKRSFLTIPNRGLNNFIAVKYHVRTKGPVNVIALHNFKDGYCGFSKIEEDLYCLCYMTTAKNLKSCGASITRLQEELLYKNPALAAVLKNSEVVQGFPITISQINFSKKAPVERGIIMLGDAAGTITPLCGNGMSMALHSSKIAAGFILRFLEGTCSRYAMEQGYTQSWNHHFKRRLKMGRLLQRFFGHPVLTNVFVRFCKIAPFIIQPLIRKTHGRPF